VPEEDVVVSTAAEVTYLVDVDNTLLDNDRFRSDIEGMFTAAYGVDRASRYWTVQERRFIELGYRDYLGAVQEWWEGEGRDPLLLGAARTLLDYPFGQRLYVGALDVLARLRALGPTVVVTDGDAILQPHKVDRAGITAAVDGNVLVYVHKELELDDVERRYPSARYVLVDDKPRILVAAKEFWGERVTTVLPVQGQFATAAALVAAGPAPDLTVTGIAELLELDL
jgi:FMN phosphatase YigB (HAD superfamily)